MHKNTLSLLAFLVLLLLGAKPSSAQAVPTDSLVGKIVHVYFPTDAFTGLEVANWNFPMTPSGKYWYTATLRGGIHESNQGFFFVTKDPRMFINKTGYASNETTRFYVEDFQGHQEMWIVIDPSGPLTAKPEILFEAPKIVNVLNPWTTTAPVLTLAGRKKPMLSSPTNCGWFYAFLLKADEQAFHFSEINNTETYGKAGLGSTENFDAASLSTTHGKNLWLNSLANTWTATFPDVVGECQYLMAATVRDFSMDHPDFDFSSPGNLVQKGMVQTALGADRKPKRTTKASSNSVTFGEFDNWWITKTDHANPKMNAYESCTDIPMSKSNDGLWEYDSFRDSPNNRSFFPITGPEHNKHGDVLPPSCYQGAPPDTNWKTGGPKHNGNFCMESHATFIYQPGQTFSFKGDDDVWVFINDKLVVDLGGVHTGVADSVKLDTLGLTAGKEYKWDFFYCDREECGSSLRVKTSIFFKQQRALFGISVPGSTPGAVSLEIWKRTGGGGSCASIGSTADSVRATNLTYQLVDVAGKVIETLENGETVHGGISIATPIVTVDTSKITTSVLVPGATYRVIAFEPTNALLKVEVPFKVPVRSFVEIIAPAVDTTAKVGELVRVIFGAKENGLPIAQIVKYVPNNIDGLLIYSNAGGTLPADLSSLTTNADGFDTLWVTGPTTAAADKKYTLSTPLPGKVRNFTFTVPKNRVEFHPWSPAIATQEVPVESKVTINTANLENGAVQAKAEKYKLNFTDGLKVYSDAAMTIPVTSGTTELSTDPVTGLGVIYATADSSALVTKTYKINILGPTSETKVITLRFIMPELVLPKALSAVISDMDGDGKGDRIAVIYDRDISGGIPASVAYRWPSSATAVTAPAAGTLIPDATALAGLITGKDLVWNGKLSEDTRTDGEGVFNTTFRARGGNHPQDIPLLDGIGPIIKSADIYLGKTHDTLRILFSEPIATVGITVAPGDLFSFKRMSDGIAERIDPVGLTWNDGGTEAVLIFDNTSADAPRSGNLIRIEDGAGRIADNRGNGAGPGSRYRVIGGGKRSEIHTVTYRVIDPSGALLLEPSVTPSLQATNSVVAEVVERTGRMGHLIKADLGGYVVQDDFNQVQTSQVALEYQVSYFTNFGLPVAGEKRVIACTDDLFKNDCLRNRGFIFVGWNNTARNGAKVGTGAYIARLQFQVKVAGKVVESSGLDQVWGVLRSR